jgi:competence protein ComEA
MKNTISRVIPALACLVLLEMALAQPGRAQAASPNSMKSDSMASHTPVDINGATKAQLVALPGIGNADAQKIMDGRPYKSKHELVTRQILPLVTYKKIATMIIAKQTDGATAEKPPQ